MKKFEPLFVVSAPKSGSTLLQRMLSTHAQIDSTDELWVALPLAYSLRKFGHFSEYGSMSCVSALEVMLQNLPNGREDYWHVCSELMRGLYSKLRSDESTYFLDKTPRYYLILHELRAMFPAAKFILLYRNPLSVISSTIEHNRGKVRGLYLSEIDIVETPRLFSEFVAAEKNEGLVHELSYESLVQEPYETTRNIMKFLDLDFDPAQIDHFAETEYTLGDRIGADQLSVSDQSIEKWKSGLATTARKLLARQMIEKIEETDLKRQGYNKLQLLEHLKTLPTTNNIASITEYIDILAATVYKKTRFALTRRPKPKFHLS